jgi:hypothetical protein
MLVGDKDEDREQVRTMAASQSRAKMSRARKLGQTGCFPRPRLLAPFGVGNDEQRYGCRCLSLPKLKFGQRLVRCHRKSERKL